MSVAFSVTPATGPYADLESLALRVREHVLRMATNGGCFVGASLSCTDLLVYLYSRVVRLSPERLADPDRDYVFLSKGHDVPALYGLLAELGYFPRERLANHLSVNDCLYWHPNRGVPGVEFHSGSLGHLLSVAAGVALDIKMRGGPNRVYVIVGDGECDEGSVWEACLVASAFKLDNLTVIVDRNHFQANVRTEELVPLEPMADKFRAFGLEPRRLSGHDFGALDAAFRTQPLAAGRPTVLICDTVRGKGLPSLEDKAERWFANFSADEVAGLLDELHGRGRAEIHSPGMIVR